jgi:hypothetical protein
MRNKGNKSKSDNEQGTALIATLLYMLAMSVLSTALVFTVQNEMKASGAYKHSEQAFYVADAGVHKAVQWFANSYSPHLPASDYDNTTLPVSHLGNDVVLAGRTGSYPVYPDSSVISAFSSEFSNRTLQADSDNSGVYALNATLLKHKPASFLDPTNFYRYQSAVERWRLNGTGFWGNTNNPMGVAEITAVIENRGATFFDRALWGKQRVDLGGTTLLDSYDPTIGPYGGANVGDSGSIGTNGDLNAVGTVDIHGDVAYGPSGSIFLDDGVNVTGGVTQLPQPRYFPPIPPFNVGSGTTTVRNGTTSLPPGEYGTLRVGANGVLQLGPGYYYFDELIEGASGLIEITGPGPTTIFVKTTLDLTGQGVINVTQDPGNLSIFYSGPDEARVTGGSGFYGEIYAANSELTLVGNSGFYGAFVGNEITVAGTADVHYDENASRRNLIARPFRIVGWSQDTY